LKNRISIDEISTAKNGIKISDIQPEVLFISDNMPEIRQQANRNTIVSIVYPDSFFIESHVLSGENRIPISLSFNFVR
jgi:hypothetical protein